MIRSRANGAFAMPAMNDERTLAKIGPTVVRYTKTRISVSEGPDKGLSIVTVNEPVRIGTSAENELVLTDKSVSRRHCSIIPTPTGYRVRDEDSTNGVLIGPVRLTEGVITGAQQLRLGESMILISPLTETVEREQATADRFGDLLGRSARMRELFADLARIAATDAVTLIEGETGTGKELVAESIHSESARRAQPLVVFDCSAVTPTLAESELFGHERGAFTGAVQARPGVFEQADGGTIFLDELGELPRDLQPKLLRVLEKREVRRVGGQRTISVDVRLVAATHRNLAAEVARGNFREDLFFRVAGVHVHVPPLRDRMEDLPLLVAHFLAHAKPPRALADIPPEIWEMFRAHRWPGNVRELKNAVGRWLITPERALRPSASPLPAADGAPGEAGAGANVSPLRIARRDAADDFERSYLRALLGRTAGNVTRAAAVAEVSRQMVQKLMRKHGID